MAWRRGDAGALDAVSRTYEALGVNLLAAEAAVVAARLHEEAGRRTAAGIVGARAADLVERCAGCRSPVLESAPHPCQLTARERHVARLAAEGLTNRQIAARWGVSVRTVESHLQHAYSKLGVSDRARLSQVLTHPPG
jgi:DNA-binding NarL/FixJ family response regulator